MDTNTFMLIRSIGNNGIYYNQLITKLLLYCDMYRAEAAKAFDECINNNYVEVDSDRLVTLTDLGVLAKSEYIGNEIHYLKLRSTAF